jgi:hypothetical protein
LSFINQVAAAELDARCWLAECSQGGFRVHRKGQI